MEKVRNKLRWRKKVTRWRIVLTDIIEGGMSERAAEEKYGLREGLVRRWYEEEGFTTELMEVVKTARLRATAMIGQGAIMAASELVSLAQCGKEETRRKACVDIIKMHLDEQAKETVTCDPKVKISDEEASAVMKALAEVKSRQSSVVSR